MTENKTRVVGSVHEPRTSCPAVGCDFSAGLPLVVVLVYFGTKRVSGWPSESREKPVDRKIRGDDQKMEPLTEEHKEYGVKGYTNAVYDQLTTLQTLPEPQGPDVSPCRVRLPVFDGLCCLRSEQVFECGHSLKV